MSSITDKQKTAPIVDQKDALGLYFDALFAEEPDADEAILAAEGGGNESDVFDEPTGQQQVNATVTPVVEPLLLPALIDNTQYAAPPIVTGRTILVTPVVLGETLPYEQDGPSAQIPETASTEIVSTEIVSTETAIALLPDAPIGPELDPELGVPEWGQSYFQCLMFKVAGINLAAPLERLNGILEWPDHITVLPKHAPWFVGLVRNREQNVQLVDLAGVINANSGQADSLDPLSRRGKYIMLIDDGHWGIASDSVSEVITLESTDVRWHDNKSQHWLVGTVVKEMCTLLDVDGLIEQLHSGF